VARAWPLVGRNQELRFVVAALRSRTSHGGVVLAGAAGVGKTRLARDALQRVAAPGTEIRWAYGTASARSTPLGAFEGLLGDLGHDPSRIVAHAVETLGSTSGTRSLIAIDDAHELDKLSALVVHNLVVRRAATVLVTLRSGERAPDAITALWKDEHLPRLELQALSAAETTALLEQVLDAPLDSTGAQRLWSLSQGNLLFLRHLVDAELQSGRLRNVSGLWQWPETPELSPELAELVRRTMGELTERVRDVVDLLALGEPLALDALGSLTEAGAVEDAEQRGLIRMVDEPRLAARLAHPLYGEVRRTEIGRLRARRLRGLIATALVSEDSPAEHLRRAVLALESDLRPDPGHFLAAAHQAVALFDLSLGERLARAAAEAGGGFEARLTQALALSWLSRGDEAEDILAGLSGSVPDDGAWALVTGARVGNLFWTLRRTDDAERLLAETLEKTEGPTRSIFMALRIAFDACLGHPRQALDNGLTLLEQPELPDLVVLMAANGVAAGGAVLGQVALVKRVAAQGYEAAAKSTEGGIPRFGLADWHIVGLRLSGDVRGAEEVAGQVRRATADILGPAHLMGLVLLGQAELARGRVRTAERWLREAWPGLRDSGHEFLFQCRMHLTQALALQGDAVAARSLLTELEADRHPAFTLMEPEFVLARAWVVASEGATSEAVAAAHAAADLAAMRSSPAYEVFALQAALGFGDHTVRGRLADLALVVEGPRAPTALRQAEAMAAGDGDGLLAVFDQWQQIGDQLAAADAAALAARAFNSQGRRGSAWAATTQAQRLAEACEGALTPALRAVARPLPLTEREREIVSLAARGLSNREIADRLAVSVRTVEGHLYRAGNKLGVSDRSELKPILEGRVVE
jgi:DNA-binding CsgD family transcriptional regulator